MEKLFGYFQNNMISQRKSSAKPPASAVGPYFIEEDTKLSPIEVNEDVAKPKKTIATWATALDHTPLSSKPAKFSEILQVFWPFFLLSKVFGICPLVANSQGKYQFRWCHPWTIWTMLLLFIRLTSLILIAENIITDLLNQVENIGNRIPTLMFNVHSSIITILALLKTKNIPRLLNCLSKNETNLKRYRNKDTVDRRDIIFICHFVIGVYMFVNFLATILFLTGIAARFNSVSATTYLEHVSIAKRASRLSPIFGGLFGIVSEVISQFTFATMDIVLLVLSLVLRRFYKRFNDYATKPDAAFMADFELEQLRADHALITSMVLRLDEELSFMNLFSFLGNAGYIFARLYLGVTDIYAGPSVLAQVDASFSFFYIFLRMMISAFAAAQLSEEAHLTLRHVKSWPTAVNIQNVDKATGRLIVINRFMRQLQGPIIGFTGSGFFVLDKSFIARLVSAILTYEIVILQFSAT